MGKRIRILVLFGGIGMSMAIVLITFVAYAHKEAVPYLPEGNTYDFGSIEEDETVSHSFTIYNRGNTTLEIHKLMSSCSCTKAEITQDMIEPGHYASVMVFYKARPLKMEDYIAVNVLTNSERMPVIPLRLICRVKTRLFWSPTSISLSKKNSENELFVSKNYAKQLELEDYMPMSEHISIMHSVNENGYVFLFKLLESCPYGNWNEEVDMHFTVDGKKKTISIPVYILNK